MYNKIQKSGFLFGFLLIAIAILIMLKTTGVISSLYFSALVSWQMLFIVVGITSLISCHLFFGGALLATGVFFLLPQLSQLFNFEILFDKKELLQLYGCVLLLLAGISAITYSHWINKKYRWNNYWSAPTYKRYNGEIDLQCAFGTMEHLVIEKPFKGACITVAFGEAKLDLSNTILLENDTCIDIKCAFGELEITLPGDWNIIIQTQSFFGGVNDMRPRKESENSKRVIIRGTIAFGELKLMSALNTPYQHNREEATEENEVVENITVKMNNKVHIIAIDEFIYIQADGDYVTLCTSTGKYLKEQTMKFFETTLPSAQFIRIHRSYIVNISEISCIESKGKESYYVVLKNGESLRASNNGYQLLKNKLDM